MKNIITLLEQISNNEEKQISELKKQSVYFSRMHKFTSEIEIKRKEKFVFELKDAIKILNEVKS